MNMNCRLAIILALLCLGTGCGYSVSAQVIRGCSHRCEYNGGLRDVYSGPYYDECRCVNGAIFEEPF